MYSIWILVGKNVSQFGLKLSEIVRLVGYLRRVFDHYFPTIYKNGVLHNDSTGILIIPPFFYIDR